jgi:aryl-alcohol dehydrogenase-like predicted oxidoreductase
VLPTCRELGIGFVPFSPLGRAVLTGAIDSSEDVSGDADFRRNMPRFQAENLARNLELVEGLGEIADAKGCTRGQLALAWLLAQGGHIAPIPGTKRVKYLEENVAAADVELPGDELARLDELFDPENVVGDRYTPEVMQLLDTDAD